MFENCDALLKIIEYDELDNNDDINIKNNNDFKTVEDNPIYYENDENDFENNYKLFNNSTISEEYHNNSDSESTDNIKNNLIMNKNKNKNEYTNFSKMFSNCTSLICLPDFSK